MVVLSQLLESAIVSGQLVDELRSRIDRLVNDVSPEGARQFAKWFDDTFSVRGSRTPKGMKSVKDNVLWFLRVVDTLASIGTEPGATYSTSEGYFVSQGAELRSRWDRVASDIDAFVVAFARGLTNVPSDVRVGGNLYINKVGLSEKVFNETVQAMERIWHGITGWRRKALDGGLRVEFAGPESFRGTVGGKYRRADDTLLVRATPKLLKRGNGSYGAIDYVLVHELGHRYEKNHPVDRFDNSGWWTTAYSRQEGETFAELFAMGLFKPSNARVVVDDLEMVLTKFENAMV